LRFFLPAIRDAGANGILLRKRDAEKTQVLT